MKVALIEDRIDRLNNYADERIRKIDFLEIITGDNFTKLHDKISKNEMTDLLGYGCLMIHRSAFDVDQRSSIISFCEKETIPLIFFSGSISPNRYRLVKIPILYINSKDFYSENQLLFLAEIKTNNVVNLLILQFGNRWKLNRLLNVRNDINYSVHLKKIRRLVDLNLDKSLVSELSVLDGLEWLNGNATDNVSGAQVEKLSSVLNALIIDAL
jgi:hypothetical protein